MAPTRRAFVALAAAASVEIIATPLARGQRYAPAQKLKPGQFTWTPDAAPAGAVVIIVSLPEQLAHVYRGGTEIGVSTCSTGKAGHRTPTGIFTILEKQRQHVSTLYKGAQMPNMERLTWGGVALHAGNLPGYPASHGCIRLPMKFSALLYDVTHLGAVVIVADERTQPTNVVHPGLLLSRSAEVEARALARHVSQRKPHGPWDAVVTYPTASLVLSRQDRRAYAFQDGELQKTYPISFANPSRAVGTHAYSLVGTSADNAGLLWLSFGLGKSRTDAHVVTWQGDSALRRVSFQRQEDAVEVARAFHPGTTLLLTDNAAPRATRTTPSDFSIITSEPAV